MEFYVVAIVISIVVLLCFLTYIGMHMNSATSTLAFPPDQLNCPDYWIMNANNACVCGSKNQGIFTQGFTIDPTKIANVGKTAICSRKLWANKNHLVWTGVDNYNLCT